VKQELRVGAYALALAGVAAACTAAAPGATAPLSPPPPPPPAEPADRVFVSQAGSSTLAVVDGATGVTEARIEVGMLPHNLVLSPDRRTLYAALVGSQAIAEIDVASASLRRTFLTAPVPERRLDGSVIQPHVDQSAFGATTCYGCHRPGGAQPKYAGDRPFGLLLSPDGRRLYVSHLRASRLAVLNLEDGGSIERTVFLAPAGAATEAVALARMGGELWVALRPPQPSTLPGALRRLDAATLEPIADLPTGADPGALLALPDTGRVLVSNFETNTVTMHDATGAASAARFEAAPGPLGLLALPGGRALAIDYYWNAISFLDLAAGTSETLLLQHDDGVPYANPTNAALASDGRRAWIVSSGTDGHLLALDLASRAIVRDFAIDGLSFGVAVVPGSLP
jgi:DNA-binding beta-propeller fold protein YncE